MICVAVPFSATLGESISVELNKPERIFSGSLNYSFGLKVKFTLIFQYMLALIFDR